MARLWKKKLYLLTLVFILFFKGTMAFALQGGPDAYGYRYVDSFDKNGPAFSMETFGKGVVTLEGKSSIGDNSLTVSYPIGFPFTYYGKSYSYLHISGNGYLVFAGSVGDYHSFPYSGQTVPSEKEPNNILAPFWSSNSGTA